MLQTDPAQPSVLTLDAAGQDTLVVPGGAWLLRAGFSVQGSDLLLTGADGAQILIRDFFSTGSPPDLMTDGGAVITAELSVKLAGPQAPGQFALVQNGPFQIAQGAEQPVGKVEATDGLVEAIHTDGSKVTLSKGSPIYQGDTIVTAKGAAIGITFVDDTTFSLGEEGRMVLDEMVYDPGGRDGSFSANLVQGVFSFVSGQIAKTTPDGMTISTPVATIGIRGTKVAGRAAQEGEQNTISLLPETDDQGNTFVGELIVTNQGGTVTLSQIGATVQMTSAVLAPPAPVVFTPQQIQQQYSAALSTLPDSPAANQDDGNGDQGGDTPPDGEAAPDGETPPDGAEAPPDGETPADGETPVDGEVPADGEAPPNGAVEQAARAALAAGASEEEVLAAATEAAAADGASPEEIAAAEQAYREAIAAGASPEQALRAAGGAAGTLAGDNLAGPGPGGPGPGPGGPGLFTGAGNPFFGGGDQFSGGDPFGGNPFGGDPFGGDPFGGGHLFGGGGDDFFGDFLGGRRGGEFNFDFSDAFDNEFDFNNPDNFFPDNQDDQTTVEFQEVLNATTGNDTLVGGDGNTQFVMVQGSTLGGVDTVDGGDGTDEIAIQSLDDAALIFDATADPEILNFSDANGTITGTVTLTDVEQLYANDGVESFSDTSGTTVTVGSNGVRLPIDFNNSGFGYIVAGNSGNDTLTLANTTNLATAYTGLSGVTGATVSTGNVLGSIIFGKGGSDNITGSESADIIFGGAGADTIDGGGTTTTVGGELIFAGPGADTINVTAATDGSTFFGGIGTDTLSYSGLDAGAITFAIGATALASARTFNSATVNDTIQGIETLIGTTGTGNGNTFSFSGDTTTTGLLTATGGDQADSFVLNSGTTVTATLDGATGTDSLTVAGTVTATIANIETITGSSGNDTLTMGSSLTSATSIDLGAGTDIVTLLAGSNTLVASNVESIFGTATADTLTLGTVQSGISVNLGAGADVLNLANGTNSLTANNVGTINGGTGADTITSGNTAATTVTGGGGADVLNLSGTGTHTARYTAVADGGDSVNGFNTGASGDVFQFATSFGGAQTISLTLESAAGAGTTGANVIIADSSLLATGTALADVQTLLNAIHTANAFSNTMNKFVIGIMDNDATGTVTSGDQYALFYDDDVTANDAVLVATTDIDASSTAASAWDAANFSALT